MLKYFSVFQHKDMNVSFPKSSLGDCKKIRHLGDMPKIEGSVSLFYRKSTVLRLRLVRRYSAVCRLL